MDATITITKNGSVVAQQNGLAPVTGAVLVNLKVVRGDVLVIRQDFRGSTDSAILSELPYGHQHSHPL